MTNSSSDSNASELDASLRASLRAALWTHRDSLDTLRDAICAFAVDLNSKGMPTAEIAATVRAVVAELRAAGERLAMELAEADPSLDQTVAWCLEYGSGAQSRSQEGDQGDVDRHSSGRESASASPGTSASPSTRAGVFLFAPSHYALRQRVDVGGGYLRGCCLAHERVDRCLRVLPGEPAALGSPDEFCDGFPKPRCRATRTENGR